MSMSAAALLWYNYNKISFQKEIRFLLIPSAEHLSRLIKRGEILIILPVLPTQF